MTDKERAQKYRQVAALLKECGEKSVATVWKYKADQLDPPKPEIPDGTICGWWKDGKLLRIGFISGNNLTPVIGQPYIPGSISIKPDMDIRPLRTLEPGQVAIDLGDARLAISALYTRRSDAAAQRILTALDRAKEAGDGD